MAVPPSLTDHSFAQEMIATSIVATAGKTISGPISASKKSKSSAFFIDQPPPKAGRGVNIKNGMSRQDKTIITSKDLIEPAVTTVAQKNPTIDQAIKALDKQPAKLSEFLLATSNEANRTLTPQSNILSVAKRLIMPNIFDRVFNIAVDPFSFEINVDETNKTPYGGSALKQLILSGDATYVFDKVLLRKRYAAEGELLFEKYFVAIETVGDE